MKKNFIIICSIAFILIISGIAIANHNETSKKQNATEIEKSINQHEYKKASILLNTTNINKIQSYTDYNLKLLKSEINKAIKFQNLYTEKKDKQYISKLKHNAFKEKHLRAYAKENYYQALKRFMRTSDYKEKLEVSNKLDFDVLNDDLTTKSEILNEMNFEDDVNGEITVAQCTEYYYNNDINSCISLIEGNNYSEKSDEVLHVLYAMETERTGEKKDLFFNSLASLDIENELPSPFKEELDKLVNKYKNNEEFIEEKRLLTTDFDDDPIIKRPEIGMTQDQVKEIWGNPKDINRTETAYGVTEQWVFFGDKYVYFDDGIVTAIQD